MAEIRKRLAAELFNDHAQAYQERFMDVGPYHASLDVLCSAIVAGNAEVLELACGPGNITKYMLSKRPELRTLATDLAPNMLALAKANNPQASFQLLDCRAILSLGRSFDAIVCGFCLPYLDPGEATQLIKDSAAVLREQGVLYLSTMEDDPAKSGWRSSSSNPDEQVYMRYYEADFLTTALEAHGFAISHLGRTQTSAADGTVFNDLMIVARKA
jgi:ubiquinone/menaquinone biosynthesis C-methylase UbiE